MAFRPRDLQQHQGPSGNLDLLIKLATITHKYHFTTTEAWTLDALCSVMSDPERTSGLWYPSKELLPVLEVAMLCEHSRLLGILLCNWEPRLLAGSLPPLPALLAADKYQLKTLQGAAYYARIIFMDSSSSPFRRSSDRGLNRDQLSRLVSGHWSLVKYWEHFRENPIAFPRFDGCTYHNQGCMSTWAARWNRFSKSEKTLRHSSVDVIGRAQCVYEQLVQDEGLKQSLTPACRTAALQNVATHIATLKTLLADFFFDRTQPYMADPTSTST